MIRLAFSNHRPYISSTIFVTNRRTSNSERKTIFVFDGLRRTFIVTNVRHLFRQQQQRLKRVWNVCTSVRNRHVRGRLLFFFFSPTSKGMLPKEGSRTRHRFLLHVVVACQRYPIERRIVFVRKRDVRSLEVSIPFVIPRHTCFQGKKKNRNETYVCKVDMQGTYEQIGRKERATIERSFQERYSWHTFTWISFLIVSKPLENKRKERKRKKKGWIRNAKDLSLSLLFPFARDHGIRMHVLMVSCYTWITQTHTRAKPSCVFSPQQHKPKPKKKKNRKKNGKKTKKPTYGGDSRVPWRMGYDTPPRSSSGVDPTRAFEQRERQRDLQNVWFSEWVCG